MMILLDDVGFGQFGCYGSDIATPNIDKLAAQGVRYNSFHVTPMCSPTRASLLTGRNHHSVGVSSIIDLANGFDNNLGFVNPKAGFLSEYLQNAGYHTMALGKWHLVEPAQQSAVGPFSQWPLGRGFDRYYGFLGAYTDQYHPELFEDNNRVRHDPTPDYHLTSDLVDHSIAWVRDAHVVEQRKPYFLYMALGACHVPHQAPKPYIDQYRGAYDSGWDVARVAAHERQLELGVIPPGTELPEQNPNHRSWEKLSDTERRVYARLQECFAGFLTHTDAELGRLVDELVALGDLDNTIILIMSDNGASHEGGIHGTLNNLTKMNGGIQEPTEMEMDLDNFGSESSMQHYPQDWATVGNSPLKLWKRYTHGGGVRAPMVAHWPAGISEPGRIDPYFRYVTDVTPTLLELAQVELPRSLRGNEQMPVHGVTMADSFSNPVDKREKTRAQYFELLGNRGLWKDGWKAVSIHDREDPLSDETWELYDLKSDFSETRELSRDHPEVLAELIDEWWDQAHRFNVFPIEDRFWERTLDESGEAPQIVRKFYPGIKSIPTGVAPDVRGRSFTIDVEFGELSHDTEGVIVSHGGRFGGYAMFIHRGELRFETLCLGERNRLEVPVALNGTRSAQFSFDAVSGVGTLNMADSEARGTLRFLPLHQGFEPMEIGRDSQTSVSEDFTAPFAIGKSLMSVEFTIVTSRV
ncbi:MAG: arylsulfatase [Cryobacterium sp.]|nr:arylsulfatase [Cryobacterium sp.]